MNILEIQKTAFLYMCGAKDRALINGEKKMTFEDFNRLTYIASSLNLNELEIYIWQCNKDRFKEEFDNLDEPTKEKTDLEMIKYTDWLLKFCGSAPCNRLKRELTEWLKIEPT